MLITCPECGKQISDQAVACPNCGMPIRKASPAPAEGSGISVMCHTAKIFNVLTGLLIALLLIAGLCLCSVALVPGVIVLLAAVIYGLYEWLKFKRCYVSLNGTTVTGHNGIIRSRKLVSPVSKVQDISISNGLLGKIFHYHTIVVSTAGSSGAEYIYKYMAHAEQLQAAFVKLSSDVK